MSELARLKRPDPQRTRPERAPLGVFRDPGPAQPGGARTRKGAAGTPLSTAEDAVVYGVRLGYRVAEEQIVKGQRLARRLRSASQRSGSGDVGDMIDATLKLSKQLGILWVEIAETLLKSPNLLRSVFARLRPAGKQSQPEPGGQGSGTLAQWLALLLQQGPSGSAARASVSELAKGLPPELLVLLREMVGEAQAPAGSSAMPPGASGRPSVVYPIAISSERLARVSLCVWREPPGEELPLVYPLYASTGEALTDVRFERVDGASPSLRVVIPKGKRAGEYRGTLVDSKGEFIGQVSVTIEGDAS